jgi:hypothetical protein
MPQFDRTKQPNGAASLHVLFSSWTAAEVRDDIVSAEGERSNDLLLTKVSAAELEVISARVLVLRRKTDRAQKAPYRKAEG